jgi:hypothetical protein
MRFFKYLIFIILSLISINSFAATYALDNASSYPKLISLTSSSKESLCSQAYSVYVANYKNPYSTYGSSSIVSDRCVIYTSNGSAEIAFPFKAAQSQCTAGETAFLDGYITSQSGMAPLSVCHSGCTYSNESGGTAFDTPNGNLSWGFDAKKTGATCSTDTPKGEDTPNGDGGDGGDGGGGGTGGGGSDGGCTETGSTATCNGGSGGGGGAGAGGGAGGGGGGSGGKGGDGGAGGAGGQGGKGGDVTINMTPVVNAINSMSSSIVNKLTSVASQITGSINDMKTAVTDAIGITNSKVQAVKDEVAAQGQQTRSEIAKNTAAVNSVKQSVDANTEAVNDMKSAVNQQTKAINDVKASVDANTTAIGAVKSAVDAVKGAVDAVASKIDKAAADTVEAVNASANKITSAISADGNATRQAINADGEATRKTMTEQGDATRSAINANGQKITDAVKENTEETKKTNSLLEDLKQWLTGEEHSENTDGVIDVVDQNVDMNLRSDHLNASASCPAPLQIPIKLFQTHTIEYKYDTFCWAASVARPWIIFVGMLVAFLIVTGQYRGGASD